MIAVVAIPDLERLFSQHAQPLFGFLAYRVGDPTIAEDLLGDTFERVVRSRHRFDPAKGSETTWIYTIALNCLRDHLRRTKSERAAVERSHVPGEQFQDDASKRNEYNDMLFRGLDTLNAGEREIIALRFGADLRLEDIAKVTGKRQTTVQGRLYTALRKLREALERDQAPSG